MVDLNPLSTSSNVQYTLNVVEPRLPPNLNPFNVSGHGTPSATLSLLKPLNRELIDTYLVMVTASRPRETVQARLHIEVTDSNDNSPSKLDLEGTVIPLFEDTGAHSIVTRSNFTDLDSGDNARLHFSILNYHNLSFPFEINEATGDIQTSRDVSNEASRVYNVTIYVHDYGEPRLENYITYTFSIIGRNVSLPTSLTPTTTSEQEVATTLLPEEPSFPLNLILTGVMLGAVLSITIIVVGCVIVYHCRRKRNKHQRNKRYSI